MTAGVFIVTFGDRKKVPAAQVHVIEATNSCQRLISRSRCCLFCRSFVHVPQWPSCPDITRSSSHHEEVLWRMILFLIREISSSILCRWFWLKWCYYFVSEKCPVRIPAGTPAVTFSFVVFLSSSSQMAVYYLTRILATTASFDVFPNSLFSNATVQRHMFWYLNSFDI
jgi:hypothetical protein